MSTIATESELLLGDYGCRKIPKDGKSRVLIGGLGLGFTLRRVLELVGPDSEVEVAELLPEVVAWNKDFLGHVNGRLLEDPRVTVRIADVFEVIRQSRGDRMFDAILLDTDHTPSSWVQASNVRLYGRNGFSLVAKALRPKGVVAYWSAGHEPEFVQKLAHAGFQVRTFEAKTYPGAKRAAHRIYVGEYGLPAAEKPEAKRTEKPEGANRYGTFRGIDRAAKNKTARRGPGRS